MGSAVFKYQCFGSKATRTVGKSAGLTLSLNEGSAGGLPFDRVRRRLPIRIPGHGAALQALWPAVCTAWRSCGMWSSSLRLEARSSGGGQCLPGAGWMLLPPCT